MKKSLIIGLSTLALTGTALLASNIYAATSTEATSVIGSLRHIHQDSESFLTTLSGEVSPAAYNATKILFDLEKTKMEALRSTTMKGDQAKIKAEFDTMKTKVDALIIAYPELKGKIPSPGN